MNKNGKGFWALFILFILLLVTFGVYIYMDKKEEKAESPQEEEKNPSEEERPIESSTPEVKVPESVDGETQKLLDSIANYVAIYQEDLNDKAIFYLLIDYIEKNVASTNTSSGEVVYTIPKETLLQKLTFLDENKNINNILTQQSSSYFKVSITEQGNNYVITSGGHGGPSNTVSLQEGKVKDGVYTLTYSASCLDETSGNKINIGTVTITLDYDAETQKFSLGTATFNKTMENYTCYWS